MKRLGLLLLGLLLLGALLPAAAQTAPLTDLARYFPGDTPAFVALRTDDPYFESLDTIRARFQAGLPEGMIGDETVAEALDVFANGLSRGTEGEADGAWAANIRTWLGDTAAAGALNIEALMREDRNPPALVALSVTNREAAEAWLTNLIGDISGIEVESTDAYMLVDASGVMRDGLSTIYIDDQVLLFTNKPEALPTRGMPVNPLSDNAVFQGALAALTAPSYDIIGYADYGAFIGATMDMAMAGMNDVDAAMMDMVAPMMDAIGGTAVGFTLLDGRALTVDMAAQVDMAALGDMAMPMMGMGAFDSAFAARLPAGTQLAIQGSDLGGSVQLQLDSLGQMAEMAAEMDNEDFDPQEIEQMMAGLNFVVQGATGLNLETEILSWMGGQYAIGASVDLNALLGASMSGDLPSEALQFAVVIEDTSGTGAQALVAGLSDTLMQLAASDDVNGLTVTEEEMGGAPAVVLTDVPSGFQLVIGGNTEVFVLGTPAMARAALSPDGGLVTDAAYQEALASSLAGSPVFMYASGDFWNRLIDVSIVGMERSSGSMTEIPSVATMFSSGSISEQITDTAVLARAVLTLAE